MAGESPHDGAPTITDPHDGMTLYGSWTLKGTAPAGSTLYVMEVMYGKDMFTQIMETAKSDGTFLIDGLGGGSGTGDGKSHIIFINVDGKITEDGVHVAGGKNSDRIHLTLLPSKGDHK